jgi:hypothetical protein|uniref:Uncharacterized protein n=1 Tax=Myoviridae sp. ctYA416 TaxID=2825125 RepID=A0A8S5UTM6_9CAUD|nr:MAG TPA: hypothetical protein [Myoviridae sp. ctYA416]
MILKDLVSEFLDAVVDTDLGNLASTRTLSVKSITKSSKDLTMIFPVMVSNTVDGTSAQLITRALERKFVSLAQILLSAISITKSMDAIDHLKNIHSNINQGSIFDIDDYINVNVVDESFALSQAEKRKVCEDYRLNFFSMNNLKQSFNEANQKDRSIPTSREAIDQYEYKTAKGSETATNIASHRAFAQAKREENTKNVISAELDRQTTTKMADEFNAEREAEQLAKERSTGVRLNRFYKDSSGRYLGNSNTEISHSDIKKSNELQPSLLKIQYVTRVKDDHIRNEALVGIKAKMYLVDSRDIMDRIIAKKTYSMSLYNLIKATTGEINFWRDFVFAIKKAKIDALSNSNRGSSNKLWKVLERRAVASKLNRFVSMRNDATAITTLVMSKYDVEMLKKEEDINILDARVARKIMDDYNLIGIVVDDASTESARFIFDTGDDEYEVYTYKTLKKEDKIDYKQMIELMAGR